MEDISREEAINNFQILENRWLEDEEMYSSTMTIDIDEEFMKSIYKAISDMEKLEKIEEVIANSTFHPNNYMASVELLKIIKDIEQIVKEGTE